MTDRQTRAQFRVERKLNARNREQYPDELMSRILAYAAEFPEHSVRTDGSAVVRADELTSELLAQLFTGRACAIHVPQFVSASTTRRFGNWLTATSRLTKWKHTDMFFGVGLPVNAMDGPKAEDCLRYFRESIPNMRRIREQVRGLAPLDKLRLELDEAWPAGANVSSDNPYRRKMFVGLGRVMRPDGMVGDLTRIEGLIHVDAPVRQESGHGGYSANVYLRVPRNGGELCIWNVSQKAGTDSTRDSVIRALLRHAFYPRHREEVQRALRRMLPRPLTIKPAPGDLVILNTQRPHAVRGFARGRRVTMQTFIVHREGRPLLLFS